MIMGLGISLDVHAGPSLCLLDITITMYNQWSHSTVLFPDSAIFNRSGSELVLLAFHPIDNKQLCTCLYISKWFADDNGTWDIFGCTCRSIAVLALHNNNIV